MYYQKRKTTAGWLCLKVPKFAATCSDRTKSYREKTLGKTENALERCHNKNMEQIGGGYN